MNKQLFHQKFALRWMRLVSLSFIIFHLSFSASAQTRVEWFFDQDPGMGRAQQALVNADGEGNVEFAPSTVGLSAGHHLLGVRIVNTDAEQKTSYGPTLLQDVLVPHTDGSQLVTRVEYFWDEDPGVGKGTALLVTAGAEVNLDNIEIPTDGLENGTHLLGIRAYGNHGWGPTMTQQVVVMHEPLKVTFVEYFWDEDPGWGKGTPLPVVAANELDLNGVELSTAELSAGLHRLGIRARGGSCWSPTVYVVTYVPLRTKDAIVEQGEYFWDEDPGYGQGTPISMTPAQEVSIDAMGITTDQLSSGRHQLFVRYRGPLGWSPTLSSEVILMPETKVLGAEYFWNEDPGYGQGTPVDLTPGEEVSLNALGIPTTDIHGDALFFIRYRGPYGWSPTLCYRILVDAEGNYTLNALAETSIDTRNYQSLSDAMTDFADRGVGNDIILTLPTTNTDYVLDGSPVEVQQQLAAISESIGSVSTLREGKTIGFKAAEGSGNTLTVTTTDEGLPTVLNLFSHTWTENVALTINGTPYDFSAWAKAPRYEELCPAEPTAALSISAPAEGMTVSFTAQPHEGTTLHGFAVGTLTSIPSVTIANSGSKTDSVAYRAVLADSDGKELATYTYYIYVRPSVAAQSFSGLQPVAGSSLNPVATQLKWNAVPGAEGYRLTITDTTGDEPVTVLDGSSVESTNYMLTVESGHHYEWQVVAVGPCDELTSPLMTLEGRLLPDLAVTAITLPEAAEAGNTVTVVATITNQGEGATVENTWTDRLYYVIDSNDFAQAVTASDVKHTGNLAAGESYQASFQLTVPQQDTGTLRVFVATDVAAKVMETDDDNNRTLSATAATLSPFYMNAADLAALRQLYNSFGGQQWNGTPWNIESELIQPGNWSGVSFDTEGHVTAINLQGRGLTGSLSAPFEATLAQLKTLNLSRNALTGDPSQFVTAGAMPALMSLNLSYNLIDELASPLPVTVTSLNLGYQHRQYGNNSCVGLDELQVRVLRIGGNMVVRLPQAMLYNHAEQAFGSHTQLYVYSSDLSTRYGTLNWSNTYETYSYAANGWQQTMPQDADVLLMPGDASALHHSVLPAQMHFTRGDANLSGLVDVNDVQRTLNYVLNQNNSSAFGLWAANTFMEEETETVINIQDIVCTVNIVLDNEGIYESLSRRMRTQAHAANLFYIDGRQLLIEAADEVAAFTVELVGVKASQLKLQLNRTQWQMLTRDTEQGVRLVVFSPTGQTLPAGITSLIKISTEGSWLVGTDATNAEAEPLVTGIGSGTPTGIAVHPSEGDTNESVYDLQGRKRESDSRLRKGIYIRNGKKVKK